MNIAGWLENPDSRPTFVVLKTYFDSFCRVPNRYLVLVCFIPSYFIHFAPFNLLLLDDGF